MLRLSRLLAEETRLSVLGIGIIEFVYGNRIQDQPLLTIVLSCVITSMANEHNETIQQCPVLLNVVHLEGWLSIWPVRIRRSSIIWCRTCVWEEQQTSIRKRDAAATVKAMIRQACHVSSCSKQMVDILEMNDKERTGGHRQGEETDRDG